MNPLLLLFALAFLIFQPLPGLAQEAEGPPPNAIPYNNSVVQQGTATQQQAAATPHHRHAPERLFIERVFPAIFLIISGVFLGMGLMVLLRKKPLLYSSRWTFGVIALCFVPQFVMPMLMPDIPGAPGLMLMNRLMPLMFIMLLAFLWFTMQGYMAYGIVDKSFRKALLASMDELGMKWQEELSVIRVPGQDLEMQVAIQSWTGVGQIKRKGKGGAEAFGQIMQALGRRFNSGEVETNNTTSVFYVVMGVFMLVFSLAFAMDLY